MNRFGIVARIALIVTVALFLSQLAAVISGVWQGGRTPPPYAIATRVVAVVKLMDETPSRLRPEVLAVANVAGFQVEIASAVPPGFQDEFSFARMQVVTQSLMDDYAPGRAVRAGTLRPDIDGPDAFAITFTTELRSGEVVIFIISDDTTLRVWNVPIGFIAGFFGIIVALLAILAVARETRPIARLAKSVDGLGAGVEPVEVKEQGARELRTLIRAINAMQKRILGLLTNRTIFLGAISHDLKTYLTRFRLRLEVMPASSHREKAILDVEAMEGLLNDVLSFARETSEQPQGETVDLGETLRECMSEIDPAGLRITLDVVHDSLPVRISQPALRRVIDNLLSNAMRYAEHAQVRAELRKHMAAFVVEDDGPGICEEDMEAVFQPFFRGEPSRNRQHGGTGLGLSIVRQIVDAHGGTIELLNRSTRPGLVVTVCLPLASGNSGKHSVIG